MWNVCGKPAPWGGGPGAATARAGSPQGPLSCLCPPPRHLPTLISCPSQPASASSRSRAEAAWGPETGVRLSHQHKAQGSVQSPSTSRRGTARHVRLHWPGHERQHPRGGTPQALTCAAKEHQLTGKPELKGLELDSATMCSQPVSCPQARLALVCSENTEGQCLGGLGQDLEAGHPERQGGRIRAVHPLWMGQMVRGRRDKLTFATSQ